MPTFLHDSDEINLLEYIHYLIKHKWWIIGITIIGSLLGYGAALHKGPKYVSIALIASKSEERREGIPDLSRFGVLGGAISSQLNLGGDVSLDNIKVIFESKNFNADMIEKHQLLPLICKCEWPITYAHWYDSVRFQWKKGFDMPNRLSMGDFVQSLYLKTEIIGKTMTIKISTKDSTLTDTLISSYLLFLNSHIQSDVQSEAQNNITLLENQLLHTVDPLLREKIQSLIAQEIERKLLVHHSVYKLINSPLRGTDFKEKRKYPMLAGSGFLFFSLLFFSTVFTLKYNIKSDKNRLLLRKIAHNIFHL